MIPIQFTVVRDDLMHAIEKGLPVYIHYDGGTVHQRPVVPLEITENGKNVLTICFVQKNYRKFTIDKIVYLEMVELIGAH